MIECDHKVAVWNRNTGKATTEVGDLTDDIRAFDIDVLGEVLEKSGVVVSMLPGDWHVSLAELAVSKEANFVSASYIAPEMCALDNKGHETGVALVNEVGLDPGIDHMMAHVLIDDYRASDAFNPQNHLSFKSYCGGIPKSPNPFRYKFSWSPLGVLKALRSSSKSIRDYAPLHMARPWDAISSYIAPLPSPESFEVYPNRDSLPFMQEYQFEDHWTVKEFVRGTLRPNGWADAWSDVFSEITSLSGPRGDARLEKIAQFSNRGHSPYFRYNLSLICPRLYRKFGTYLRFKN